MLVHTLVSSGMEGPAAAFPATPKGVTDINGPLSYAVPEWTAYDPPNVGTDGPPIDFLGATNDDPNEPPAWRRRNLSKRQVGGVAYNLNDNVQATQVQGVGNLIPHTEWTQNMGGTVTLFPFTRYESTVQTDPMLNRQGRIYIQPPVAAANDTALLTEFVPYFGP